MGCARRAGWVVSLVLFAVAGCARPVRHEPWAWSDAVDRDHPAVVLLDNDCSGTLVTPRLVLTAAHCTVRNDAMPRVVIGDGATRARWDVLRCHLHPRAYGPSARCLDDPHRDVVEEHDLAMLELGRPVPPSVATPLSVWLAPDPSLRDERLFLVGYHRRPLVVGTVRRYGGWNEVVAERGGTLTTLPLRSDPQRFSTRPGASGGSRPLDSRRSAVGGRGALGRSSAALPRFDLRVDHAPGQRAFHPDPHDPPTARERP